MRAITKGLVLRTPTGAKGVLLIRLQLDGFGRCVCNARFVVTHFGFLDRVRCGVRVAETHFVFAAMSERERR
jgi:hypothetical protein